MIFEKIRSIIANQLNIHEDSIEMDSSLVDDLDVDSLDAFQILSEIEDEFAIEIPDEDIEKISTVQDIVDYIENVL